MDYPLVTSFAPAPVPNASNALPMLSFQSMPADRLQEPEQTHRHLVVFNKAPAQLVSDLHGHVAGPAFGSIEGDDTHRTFILSFDQVADHCRAISSLIVGLTPRPTETRAKIVKH